jgi:hypothetical protein
MEQVIYRTPNYKVVVGKDLDNQLVYQIINIKYKVIEVETKLYPQAIKYASDLEANLAAIIDYQNESIN